LRARRWLLPGHAARAGVCTEAHGVPAWLVSGRVLFTRTRACRDRAGRDAVPGQVTTPSSKRTRVVN